MVLSLTYPKLYSEQVLTKSKITSKSKIKLASKDVGLVDRKNPDGNFNVIIINSNKIPDANVKQLYGNKIVGTA